jgi:ABC-type uncharacterized transport system auxiliary subunit
MGIKHAVPLMLLTLLGCASAPDVDYFTVDMTRSGSVEAGVNLLVGRFTTTEALGRSQILIQASPTRIDYYAVDRWASGVGELVQRKLITEFGPIVEGRRSFKITGRVLAFEQVDGETVSEARVALAVAIRDAEAKSYEEPLLEKTYDATRNADGVKPDAVVVALSRAMEQIAAEIAADVAKL